MKTLVLLITLTITASSQTLFTGVKVDTLYENGRAIIVEKPYVNGIMDGVKYVYTLDGKLLSHMMYDKGRQHGPEVLYDPETGEKRHYINLHNGLVHGIYDVYNPDGSYTRDYYFYGFYTPKTEFDELTRYERLGFFK